MDLLSRTTGFAAESSELSTQTPPPRLAARGPRRIDPRRGWRRLRRVGLAGLAGLSGGLLSAWALAGDALPPMLRLPQPDGAVPATELLIPLLLCALGLLTLWRLSAWLLPLLMAGLLLGAGLPQFFTAAPDPAAALALLTSTPVLAALGLPLLAAALNRSLLRRLGLTGQLKHWRDVGLFGLLAGFVAPLLGGLLALAALWLAGLTAAAAAAGALTLTWAWALGLVSAGTALQTSSQPPRRGQLWLARSLAAASVLAQAGLAWRPGSGAWMLLPHLLLCLHALQASPRSNASLGSGLLLLWALAVPAGAAPLAAGAALACLPLLIVALSQQQLRERDGWRGALDAQGLALAEWRLPEGRRHASARWLALTTPPQGTAPGSAPLDWLRLAHPRDREPVRRALRELLVDGTRNQLAVSLRLAADGGDWRWHELQAHVPLRDRGGRARGLIATLADTSWRHMAEERERMSATLFQQSGEGLAVVDMQWRIVEVNPAYCEIVHAPRETLIGRLAAPLSVANLRRSGLEPAAVQAELKAGQIWRGQLETELEDGGRHVFAAKLSPVPEPDGVSPRWRLLSLTDLGETLRQQDLLRRRLRYDVATGLPNRDEFMRLLQLSLVAANRDGFKLLVGIIDLDDFGRVNIEHGQLVADAVLQQLSSRLQSTLRRARSVEPDTADQLARLHGDEFAVLMRVESAEEAQRGAERLLGVLSTPVAVRESRVGNGIALEIGASMGATLYPQDEADPETLLRHASHALYRAKHAGRAVIQFHDPTLDPRDEASLIAVARLQRALDGNELLLHYQPQIDLLTGQVNGVEALLRWQHPERGLLTPAHFLPLVAKTGLAVQIGDWVIEQALAQAAAWLDAGINGGKGLQVSVNVGIRQLSRHDFPQRLQELVQRQAPTVAPLLHLDVLEADALLETAAAQALIQRCLGLGIGIALDDFGAGYSRLASLKRLPVDTLKLDRSYVQGMLGDAQDLSLVESVIGLARNIGCTVLAKGVESRAHARELLRLGCRLGQGNGIAAAMDAAALARWLETFARSDWAGQFKTSSQLTP